MRGEWVDFYLRSGVTLFGAGSDYVSSDYVVFGVPFDSTSSFRPGSRFGPISVRAASQGLCGLGLEEKFRRLADLGDLFRTCSVRWMLKRTWRVARELTSLGKRLIILGGEHTLTLAAFMASHADLLIIFDAHLDLMDEYMDLRISHATWLRRLMEKRKARAAVIGFRDYVSEEYEFGGENLAFMASAERVHKEVDGVVNDVERLISDAEKIYISIDLDVLDPAYAPGVGNPAPFGLSPTQLISLLRAVMRKGFQCLDLVEVNPLFDNGETAVQAAALIREAITFSST